MSKAVDLNCDLGESFGAYTIGMDEEVIKLVSSVNVACGFHASDPVVMKKTVEMAAAAGAGIGAHPGFYDLMGFGRRNMNISPKEAYAYVTYQLGALNAFCVQQGVKIQHVKPHGALYNMAGKDYELAKGICCAIYDFNPDIILLGLSGSQMIRAGEDIGLRCAKEFFADRAYEDDGSLRARTKEGAMIEDEGEAIDRVVKVIKTGKVTTYSQKDIDLEIDSVCVHGDNVHALDFVKAIRERLGKEGIEIAPLSKI
ncbi:MAG: 5-oxoprolinase subunit PxpA [Lachnospiraceae bacterium]|nr:5-oxoprolinase subunit PxpA [Lachnospiraceae bacterium]